MSLKFYNLAKMTVTGAPGIGSITLGSAVSGFLTFAQAGISDGDQITYAISDGANCEIGRGTYTASGTSLSRDTVLRSSGVSNTGKISATSSAIVFICAAAEDLSGGRSLLATLTASASTNLDFTGISSLYDRYEIELENVIPATSGATMTIQFSQDGGSTFIAAGYSSLMFGNAETTTYAGYSAGIIIAGGNVNGVSGSVSSGACGRVTLSNPNSTTMWKRVFGVMAYPDPVPEYRNVALFSGIYSVNTNAINALRFKMSSGNIASGKIRIYGVRG